MLSSRRLPGLLRPIIVFLLYMCAWATFPPAYARQVDESRRRIYAACERLGLTCWPSAANFVLVRVGDTVAPFVQAMAARNVHVRDRSKDPATPGCIRITAGVLEHTERAIEALESVVGSVR